MINSRNSELAKIHVAKKQLQMTNDDYLAMLWTQGRVRSSADLDHAGRRKVLDYLSSIGFKPIASPQTKRPARPIPTPDKLPLVRRIRAQLISLGRLPDTYADGIVKQMLGVDAPDFFEWCNPSDLHKVTQALGVEQQRKGVAK
ncbi:regulatory protein GemA [Limnohabitans sp.]|uniref:gp16 family protein n=1 Tax=Limnohabitans sp. TaxID=1907725 RepID=UPI00286EE896|nr:regulatory protein GemA [Limnohabitans sp.]